jgi:NDP-sugar pyrophosphorylase family protein
MTALAMIMAGGQGTRMSQSGVSVAKALVPVAGVPLIEHNLDQLLRYGFDEIVIVTPPRGSPVAAFVRDTLIPKAGARGRVAWIYEERAPLGNIGAVQILADRDAALIVYADNLTALDLRVIYEAHRQSQNAMTIAVHRHPFTIPYGEVRLQEDRVVGYDEKPVHYVDVCSAISVIEGHAMAMIAPGEKLGLSELVRRLLLAEMTVGSFRHDAPWIDVNDQSQIGEAERLFAENAVAFGRT